MPLPKPKFHRFFSSVSSPTKDAVLALSSPTKDAIFADKALSLLISHPSHLNSLSSQFTPEAASLLLLKSQNDQNLTLSFINWAKPHHFFNLHCKCLALHILTKFKLYKTGQALARDLALTTTADCTGSVVFQCLKETYHLCGSSSAVFDLVVKSYSHLNFIDKALNIVHLAKFDGFMPGVLSYNAILEAIVRLKKPVRFSEEVHREMMASGISLNVFSYNVLIRGFCGAGNFEMGLRLFKEMERNGCLPNVVTYNTMIDACCKLRKIDEAFGLLRLMVLKGLEANLITYNVIINGLCREGRMKETSSVLAEMNRKGFVPDEVTYNTLVNGFCKEGNFHRALELHAEMVTNGLSPNVVTYTSLINSICQAGNLNLAMEFLYQMCVRGLSPNERTYTTLINGFSQQGFLNEAYRLLQEMINKGFSPSIVTYNALINGHCVLGRMEEAMRLLKDMVEKGLFPDVVSYSTIISGFTRNQELDRAFQIKTEMLEKGILPDTITYSSLIQCLCEQGRLFEAYDLFQEMMTRNLAPNEFTYKTLINCYCKEGDLNMAFKLHSEMIQKDFLPDVAYSVLINGLIKQAQAIEAKRFLLKLFYDESVPNDVTYNALIDCSNIEFTSVVAILKEFCMKGLMKEADHVFESMIIEKNHKPNAAVYNVIIHGHCRDRNAHKAYNLYKEMLLFGFVPHAITIIALVKALYKEGMNEELKQVIKYILRNCKLTNAEVSKVLRESNHEEGNMDLIFNYIAEMVGLIPISGALANTLR